jgi:hypothetical protein
MGIDHQVGQIEAFAAIRGLARAFGQRAFATTSPFHPGGQVLVQRLIAYITADAQFHKKYSLLRIIIMNQSLLQVICKLRRSVETLGNPELLQ